MRGHGWAVVAMAMMMSAMIPRSSATAQVEVAATLSVLSEPVERIPAATGVAEAGASGMNLVEGDRVRAGEGGVALITFLDGTTVTVLSRTDVTVKQAGAPGRSGIRILIHAGRVWARIVEAAGSRSGLTLESNEYSATARDGLIGAEKSADGFVCWTRRGHLAMENSSGHAEALLMAGQWGWARMGLPVKAEPFLPSSSLLEIRTSGPVVPLVLMPGRRLAAGFLDQSIEVNQVFGALTEAGTGARRLVEVPAGTPGDYTLILTGVGEGPFTVRVTGRYAGFRTLRQEITGETRPGERVFSRISQRVKGDDPLTARATETRIDRLQAWDGEEPATVVAAPLRARGPRLD
ncbi:MAG TPA: hypothetical protein VF653_16790 [Methylomirabilota bacterium]